MRYPVVGGAQLLGQAESESEGEDDRRQGGRDTRSASGCAGSRQAGRGMAAIGARATIM